MIALLVVHFHKYLRQLALRATWQSGQGAPSSQLAIFVACSSGNAVVNYLEPAYLSSVR